MLTKSFPQNIHRFLLLHHLEKILLERPILLEHIFLFLALLMLFSLTACSQTENEDHHETVPLQSDSLEATDMNIPDNFILIKGGAFQMGSPESEAWRSTDETQHRVTVSDFYMSRYELTQQEYEEITGSDPSNFSGENLPVENVSWLDAVT